MKHFEMKGGNEWGCLRPISIPGCSLFALASLLSVIPRAPESPAQKLQKATGKWSPFVAEKKASAEAFFHVGHFYNRSMQCG